MDQVSDENGVAACNYNSSSDEPGLCNCYGNYYDCNGVCESCSGATDGPGVCDGNDWMMI